jgi:hypothetical protein
VRAQGGDASRFIGVLRNSRTSGRPWTAQIGIDPHGRPGSRLTLGSRVGARYAEVAGRGAA